MEEEQQRIQAREYHPNYEPQRWKCNGMDLFFVTWIYIIEGRMNGGNITKYIEQETSYISQDLKIEVKLGVSAGQPTATHPFLV